MQKIKLIGLSLLLSFGLTVHAQENFSFQAGKVSQYEMSMTEYQKHPEAEAIVIYEFGENYMRGDGMHGSFLLHKKKQIKIKILKESGLKYADFEIPLYVSGTIPEQIDITEALVYNVENGALVRTTLDRKKVFEEKVNDRWIVKKFTMPNVKEGSVIEVEYNISTPYFFNMGNWEFQKKIPVVYSRLNYRAIPYYEYTYVMKGANKFDEFRSEALNTDIRHGNLLYREMEYTFGMKNLPPFIDEEFITSPKDYMIAANFQLSKINFPTGGNRQIMSTWLDLCNEFLKHSDFGKYINNSEKHGKKILPELKLSGLSPEEQIKAIAFHVKSEYSWNGEYGRLAHEKLADFLKNKKGNDGNLNLYLVGLLKAAGLDAVPILLSTRRNGQISYLHPFEDSFNYTIAMVTVDGQLHFLDATEPLLYYNELPARCLNVQGLVVKPKSEEWVAIYQNELSVTEKQLRIKKVPNQNLLDVQVNYTNSGNSAYNFRATYLGKADNLSQYLKETNNINTKGDIVVENENNLHLPFKFSFNFETEAEETPEKLFITPFCRLSMSDNPFKQASRKLPVDLVYVRGEKYKSTIEIPEGYKVEFIPKDGKIDNKALYFNYTAVVENNTIKIEAEYSLKKSVYPAPEYMTLKNCFTIIIKKISEMVVLVKE